MDSSDTLSDLENWTPIYESATWPTVSTLPSMLLIGVLYPVPAIAHQALQEYNVGQSVVSAAPFTDFTEAEETMTYYQVEQPIDQLLDQAKFRGLGVNIASAQEVLSDALQGLSLASLARIAFPDTRQMEAWEQKATDKFFLSHFK